jgi:uncharacterized Tic20 family protein
MEQSTRNYISSEAGPVYTPTSDEKTLAILAHALNFVFPLLAPFIIYLVKRDDSRYVAEHARESLNFQISVAILYLCLIPLVFIIVGVPLMIALAIFHFVVVIIASIKASDNKIYRYPLNFRIIN